MCKYGLLYLVASAIAVLRVQLRFVDCINKRKKKTYNELFVALADDELFSKARLWSNHVLHALLSPLPAASQRYNFRQRPHSLQLPEHKTQLSNCNFLYKNTY